MDSRVQSQKSAEFVAIRIGTYLLALGTVGAGILDLIWGDFDPGHQPFGGLGYDLPAHAPLVYVTAIGMILAGLAVLWQRTARQGALATAAVYSFFALLSIPHFYTMSQKFGFHVTVILGVVAQLLLQFIVVAGCMILYASFVPNWDRKSQVIARVTFGVGPFLFGLGHLANTKGIAQMVPKWMLLGGSFWVVLSGIGFMLAGAAILVGILNLLAARLLAAMLLIFEIILVPIIFASPHVHQAWGATAYNLAVAGSVWIYAASLESRKAQRAHDIAVHLTRVS